MFGVTLVCCTVLINFFNPLISLERTFKEPIYQIKKMFNSHVIKPKDSYTIVLVGDSMTDYLGSGVEIKKYLKKYYPNKEFEIKNFSIGSTNILTLPGRLQNLTNIDGKILEAILNTNFDLIIIESFGHNPLTVGDGLKKHNQTMDKVVSMIKDRQPWARVVLMATLAPHSSRYAEGAANLTPDERKIWAQQRKVFIENHIEYAKTHKLPVINIYQESFDNQGEANADYIDTRDYVHPSLAGVDFISREIADFIFKNRIFPL